MDNVSRATTISSVKNILITYFIVKNVRSATHFCVEIASPNPISPERAAKPGLRDGKPPEGEFGMIRFQDLRMSNEAKNKWAKSTIDDQVVLQMAFSDVL